MVCNWILYSVDLVTPEMRKIAQFTLPCQKCQKSCIICFAKMLKIALLLWKDFCQKSMLAEGSWSIPCLPTSLWQNSAHLRTFFELKIYKVRAIQRGGKYLKYKILKLLWWFWVSYKIIFEQFDCIMIFMGWSVTNPCSRSQCSPTPFVFQHCLLFS